jgi:hypothetical protein
MLMALWGPQDFPACWSPIVSKGGAGVPCCPWAVELWTMWEDDTNEVRPRLCLPRSEQAELVAFRC